MMYYDIIELMILYVILVLQFFPILRSSLQFITISGYIKSTNCCQRIKKIVVKKQLLFEFCR